MPYTATQLTGFFTTDNGGVGPDTGTSVLFATYAQQDSASLISDLQALKQTLQTSSPTAVGYNAPSSTTDVALGAYEYLTGAVPTAAGLNYLLDHVGTGLTTVAYSGFNQETRYQNMVIDLAMAPASSASAGFAATYGGLTFNQAVQVAYEKIVGLANVGSARDAAAIADISSRQAYFTAVAADSPSLNQPLTAIAAMIGYVLHEAVKADVGAYAVAFDNFNFNLATGGTVNYGTDITTSYPATSPYAGAATGGQQFVLTTSADNLAGGAGNDVFTGTYSDGGIGGGNTFNIGDRLIGGGGSDTLTISPNITVGAGSAATTLPDTLWAAISGIGNLSVSTNAGALNLTAGPNFSAAFASGLSLTLNTGAGAISLDLGGSGASAFAGSAVIVANTTGAGAQTINAGSGPTAITASAFSGAQTVIGSNLTTVSMTNSGAGAQTLTSSGSGAVTATVIGVSGAQTINTGGGADTLNVTTSAGATNLISTGAGADIITLSSGGAGSHNTIVAGAGADLVNLGSHVGSIDTLVYAVGDSWASSMDLVTNMRTTDLLSFPSTTSLLTDGAYTAVQTGLANLTAVETGGLLTFGGSAAAGLSASTAIAAAIHLASLAGAAGVVDGFVLGNATYIVEFNAVAPIVVELVGVNATGLAVAGATVHFI